MERHRFKMGLPGKNRWVLIVAFCLFSWAAQATPPSFHAAGTADSGNGAVTPTVPSLPASTSVVLICFIQSSNETIATPTNSGGTNWTSISWSQIGAQADVSYGTPATAGAYRLGMYWCRLNTTTVTPGTVSIADSGNHNVAQILAFTNCITTGNPYNLIGAAGGANTWTVMSWNWVSAAALSTTVDDALVVAAGCGAYDVAGAGHISPIGGDLLTSATERADVWASTGTGGGFGVLTGTKATAGQIADGGTSYTNDLWFITDSGTSFNNGMRVIELLPIVTGPTPTAAPIKGQFFHFFKRP